MALQITVGASAVLLTWAALTVALMFVGLSPAIMSRPSGRLKALRWSMWWGLLITTLTVLFTNLFLPLRSTWAAVSFLGVFILFAALGLLSARHHGSRFHSGVKSSLTTGSVLLLAVLGFGLIYTAVAALGPVTNYDTGLYHLGAVKYSGDFATIPGIANLMNPIGYNNSLFPMAAALGNGPWDGIGYRLVNGLFMFMMAIDLLLRLLERRNSVGTYILLVSVISTWIPLVALSDYWVSSPTSDTVVMILSLTAVSYFADSIQGRSSGQQDAVIAVLLSVLIIAMRPTMVFFLVTVIAVIAIRSIRSKTVRSTFLRWPWLCGSACAVALLAVQVVRDYRLSGWLEYPLSIAHFDVPWAAADPVYLRTATLGAARDPENLWAAATGWRWVPPWFAHTLTQWETYFLAVLGGAAIFLCVAARMRGSTSPRRMMLALLPSVVSVATWWLFSPPAFRFIWGPLFSLALIPMGWAAHSLVKHKGQVAGISPASLIAFGGAGLLSILIVFCALTRLNVSSMTEVRHFAFGPVGMSYVVTPIPRPPTAPATMSTGLVIQVPTQSDQCWDVYPLCASGMGSTIGMLGSSIQDGFTH